MKLFTPLFRKLLFALLIACGAFATNVQAQNDAITVSVPFPFTVGSQSIGPGTYEFSLVSGQFVLSVADMKTGHMTMFNVLPKRQGSVEERGRLTFGNVQGRRILNEVHFPGTDTFSELTQRRAKRTEPTRSSTAHSVSMAQR